MFDIVVSLIYDFIDFVPGVIVIFILLIAINKFMR